jgi:beta-lactamase regulating signal transducer with metallopeptidase domain
MMIDVMVGGGWGAFATGMLLKGMLVLLMATGATFLLRGGSAAARHWVWFLALVGLLALPVAGLVVPGWSLEVPVRSGQRATDDASWAGGEAVTPSRRQGDFQGVARPAATPPGEDVTNEAAASPRSRTAPDAGPEVMNEAEGSPVTPRAFLSGARVLLLLWVGGVFALLTRLTISHVALRRLENRARPTTSERIRGASSALSARMGLRRPVRLLEGGRDAMPMSWGLIRPRILLPSDADRWPTDRLSSVLLHELAHVSRRDCLSQLVAEVAVALHWPNPLAWLASHRLRVEREHACDDAVLVHGARATRYASELVALARELRTLPASAPAGVAMAGPGHLRQRIRAVLDADRPRRLGRRFTGAAAALAAGVVGMLAAVRPVQAVTGVEGPSLTAGEPLTIASTATEGLPAHSLGTAETRVPSTPVRPWPAPSQSATCGLSTQEWRRSSVQSNDDRRYRLEWSRPGCSVEVRIDGEVTFASDFRDLERLGRGASVRIEEDDDGTVRSLEITPDASGHPAFAYRIDRQDRAFDAAARAWYEGMMLMIVRRSGFMAEERVASMLRAGGVQSVLDELDVLATDHVFTRYTIELIEQADLSESQAVSLVEEARRRVDSDHYMAEVLTAVSERHLDSEAGMNAFLAAASTLESDHYRAQVLGHALERRQLTRQQVATLIDEVGGMESDHYVSEVLRAVAQRYFVDAATRGAYLRAVSTVESDHYRTEILGALLDRNDLDAGELDAVLEAVAAMESPHYQTELLRRMSADGMTSRELSAYLRIVEGMGSDHYQSESLRDLATKDLSEADLIQVVRTVGSIDSDHYKAQLLVDLAREHGSSEGAVRDALVDAMGSIESKHYRGQVAEVLVRR